MLHKVTAENEKVKQHLEQLKAKNRQLIHHLQLVINEAAEHRRLVETGKFCFENIHIGFQ